MAKKKFIEAVDVGTTKVAAIAGTRDLDGHIDVLGFGQAASNGVKRGSVFNIMEAAESVRKLLKKLKSQWASELKRYMST